MPTKPGHAAPGNAPGNAPRNAPRNAIDDTVAAEPSVEPIDPSAAVRSIPPAERYRLGAELGRGGMGRVVEAFDLQLGRTVALKEVLPRGGPGVARRFAREVQLTARLEHPSIVPLYDAGVTVDGRPFYVMRRVSGRPLDQLMAGAAGLAERLTLVPAVLSAIDAIAHAHRRRVIHRDLKPANILVGDLGDTVVIDWGLAKVIGEPRDDDAGGAAPIAASDSLRTQIGSVFGTPGFMAPEQARGEELDPRGDVYALGATLYQLLAGAPPHTGTSATEVIASTGARAVTPVDVVAPGAPAELVAIVGKALAFDPDQRYPDAGALGEDVRRFLTGQLVAAHRYTRRQRVTRFARRHRAPLGVAAAAAVAVAALSWISVHRIIVERDIADDARAIAVAESAAAGRARDDAQRRADQLVAMHARGLVDRNPTHALAVLKQLPAASPRLDEARAVAQAAVVRGVAWSMPSSEALTVIAELSPDGRFLLQVTRDGAVQVWDLDHRRLVVARNYPRDTRAVWAGKALFVYPETAAPERFDPFTGAVTPIAIDPVRYAVATADGRSIALYDRNGHAQLLDVAASLARPLWPGHVVEEIEIAGDGSWIELADKTTVAIVDPRGNELATRPGSAVRLLGSPSGQVGFATAAKVALCTLSPTPVWSELALPPYPIDFAFRGHDLYIYLTTGKLLAWNGTRSAEVFSQSSFTSHMVVVGNDLLVVPAVDGRLHVLDGLITGELHLPTPLRNLRIAGRPGTPRIVAVGTGRIVVFDLVGIPARIAARDDMSGATFVDDDTVLLWGPQGGPWQWNDLRTGTTISFDYDARGLAQVIGVDPDDGRVLVRELAGDNDSSLVVFQKTNPKPRRLVRGRSVWGELMSGGSLLFGVGDGRLLAIVGDAAPRELAKLDDLVEAVTRVGATGFAAISGHGELVRGDIATGALVRAHVTPSTTTAIAADRDGRVVLAQDNRLQLWDPSRPAPTSFAKPTAGSACAPGSPCGDAGLVELARLDKRILRIEPCDGGALLELADHSVVRASLVPGAPIKPVLAAASRSPLISRDGKLVIGETVNAQVTVVETASSASWDLPGYFSSADLVTIAPTARRFIQFGAQRRALWTLPLAPADLAGWLDERTNARTDEADGLTWSPPGHP